MRAGADVCRQTWNRGISLAAVTLVSLGAPVYGQGFMVKPMAVDVNVYAGRSYETNIEVRNTQSDQPCTVEAGIVPLGQSGNGTYTVEADSDPPAAGGRSAVSWIQTATPTQTLQPLAVGEVRVRFAPPRGSRGTYAAGLVVRRPASGDGTVRLVLQFLVPFIVSIQGPTAREDVVLGDLRLGYQGRPEAAGGGGVCYVGYTANNRGECLAKVSCDFTVLVQSGTTWQRVLGMSFEERSLLPGKQVLFAKDVERHLPAGKYRLTGSLRIAGRQRHRLETEVEFEGDPQAKTLAVDVPLRVSPSELELSLIPGSRRQAPLSVSNPSSSPVSVAVVAVAPPALEGVALGEVDGAEFQCNRFLKVEPAAFELRPGAMKNLRVTAEIPAGQAMRPLTFADVVYVVKHADGQTAGRVRSRIILQRTGAKASFRVAARPMVASLVEDGKYAVTARFENHGETRLAPKLDAALTTAEGRVVATVNLECPLAEVLPLSTVVASGVLNLARVDRGAYVLIATLRSGADSATSTLPVRVELEGNTKVLAMVEQVAADGQPAPAADPPKAPAADAPAAPAVGAPAAP